MDLIKQIEKSITNYESSMDEEISQEHIKIIKQSDKNKVTQNSSQISKGSQNNQSKQEQSLTETQLKQKILNKISLIKQEKNKEEITQEDWNLKLKNVSEKLQKLSQNQENIKRQKSNSKEDQRSQYKQSKIKASSRKVQGNMKNQIRKEQLKQKPFSEQNSLEIIKQKKEIGICDISIESRQENIKKQIKRKQQSKEQRKVEENPQKQVVIQNKPKNQQLSYSFTESPKAALQSDPNRCTTILQQNFIPTEDKNIFQNKVKQISNRKVGFTNVCSGNTKIEFPKNYIRQLTQGQGFKQPFTAKVHNCIIKSQSKQNLTRQSEESKHKPKQVHVQNFNFGNQNLQIINQNQYQRQIKSTQNSPIRIYQPQFDEVGVGCYLQKINQTKNSPEQTGRKLHNLNQFIQINQPKIIKGSPSYSSKFSNVFMNKKQQEMQEKRINAEYSLQHQNKNQMLRQNSLLFNQRNEVLRGKNQKISNQNINQKETTEVQKPQNIPLQIKCLNQSNMYSAQSPYKSIQESDQIQQIKDKRIQQNLSMYDILDQNINDYKQKHSNLSFNLENNNYLNLSTDESIEITISNQIDGQQRLKQQNQEKIQYQKHFDQNEKQKKTEQLQLDLKVYKDKANEFKSAVQRLASALQNKPKNVQLRQNIKEQLKNIHLNLKRQIPDSINQSIQRNMNKVNLAALHQRMKKKIKQAEKQRDQKTKVKN